MAPTPLTHFCGARNFWPASFGVVDAFFSGTPPRGHRALPKGLSQDLYGAAFCTKFDTNELRPGELEPPPSVNSLKNAKHHFNCSIPKSPCKNHLTCGQNHQMHVMSLVTSQRTDVSDW